MTVVPGDEPLHLAMYRILYRILVALRRVAEDNPEDSLTLGAVIWHVENELVLLEAYGRVEGDEGYSGD